MLKKISLVILVPLLIAIVCPHSAAKPIDGLISANPALDEGLLEAASKCDQQFISIALKRGANSNVRQAGANLSFLGGGYKPTPLIAVVAAYTKKENSEICVGAAKLLLNAKANPNVMIPESGVHAPSALFALVTNTYADPKMLQLLLQSGANPNIKLADDRLYAGSGNRFAKGATPLMVLVAKLPFSNVYTSDEAPDAMVVFEMLLKASQINERNSLGQTALMIAADKRRVENSANRRAHAQVVSALLDRGANPNLKDKQGLTALDYAIKNNNAELAGLLSSKTQ